MRRRSERDAPLMVAPGMLQNPAVRNWLGGVEPAWLLLDIASLHALRRPPSPLGGPIRLAADLTADEIQQSAVARNALILLRAAAEGAGLKLTTTGNLSRAVVAEMCDRFSWPGLDKATVFRFRKVVNEPDFLPLYFVRHITETAKMLRRYRGFLRTTPAGRQVMGERHERALQALLFHLTFWLVDLGYLGRDLLHGWPQRDVGVVLWSLSVAANDWQSPERLSRMCTIPINAVLESEWDNAALATEARILRPLQWFGLMEHRREDVAGSQFDKRHFYRKTALFDRFLSFDVTLDGAERRRH